MWLKLRQLYSQPGRALLRGAGAVILLEQLYEFAVMGVSLAENPALVIAALGALGFPLPNGKDGERA